MKKFLLFLLLPTLSLTAQPLQYRIVGYYASWNVYGGTYYVDDIPADKVTHLNYAFVNVSEEGECILGDKYGDVQYPYVSDSSERGTDADGQPLAGNINQFLRLRDINPDLKLLFSVGGWTWSSNFSEAALTPESRARFAASCVEMVRKYKFDGLDIDWEYPITQGEGAGMIQGVPEDKQNYTLLLAELRQQLDALGEGYLLSIAAPAVPFYWNNMEIDKLHPYLDYLNLMAYDMYVGEVASHHAALYNSELWEGQQHSIQTAVEAYLNFGVPAEKIVVGVPFYGHGRAEVSAINNGLFQAYNGRPAGTWASGGLFSYADLVANYLSSATSFRDESVQAAWYYDAASQIMISYDDPTTLAAKATYIRENQLGGMMIWELGYDDQQHTLLNAVYEGLIGE